MPQNVRHHSGLFWLTARRPGRRGRCRTTRRPVLSRVRGADEVLEAILAVAVDDERWSPRPHGDLADLAQRLHALLVDLHRPAGTGSIDDLERAARSGQLLLHLCCGRHGAEASSQRPGVSPRPVWSDARASHSDGTQVSLSTTWSMQWVSAATSSGSTAVNIAMRSWLRPSLRYDSVSTMPLRRRTADTARRRSQSSRSIVATTWLRSPGPRRTASRARRLGPAVEDLGRLVAARRRPLEAAVAVDPLDLLDGQEHRGERRRVVGLVLAAVVEGGAAGRVNAGIQRSDAAMRSMRSMRCRRHCRDPQAAVRAEVLLRREVVDVDLRRVEAESACSRCRVDQHELRRQSHRPDAASRMATPVEVSLWVRQ